MPRTKVGPLQNGMPIVDPETGAPTFQFIHLWNLLFGNEEDSKATAVTAEAAAADAAVLAGLAAPQSRLINTTAPLTGGGDLSSDLTLGVTLKDSIIISCSDAGTPITTGTGKMTFRMPYAFTLTGVRASVTVAPTGSTIIINIKENGASILSTKLSIDIGEKTSTTAAAPAVISDTALADDAEITIDFDQVGSTIAGEEVKVYLIGY